MGSPEQNKKFTKIVIVDEIWNKNILQKTSIKLIDGSAKGHVALKQGRKWYL